MNRCPPGISTIGSSNNPTQNTNGTHSNETSYFSEHKLNLFSAPKVIRKLFGTLTTTEKEKEEVLEYAIYLKERIVRACLLRKKWNLYGVLGFINIQIRIIQESINSGNSNQSHMRDNVLNNLQQFASIPPLNCDEYSKLLRENIRDFIRCCLLLAKHSRVPSARSSMLFNNNTDSINSLISSDVCNSDDEACTVTHITGEQKNNETKQYTNAKGLLNEYLINISFEIIAQPDKENLSAIKCQNTNHITGCQPPDGSPISGNSSGSQTIVESSSGSTPVTYVGRSGGGNCNSQLSHSPVGKIDEVVLPSNSLELNTIYNSQDPDLYAMRSFVSSEGNPADWFIIEDWFSRIDLETIKKLTNDEIVIFLGNLQTALDSFEDNYTMYDDKNISESLKSFIKKVFDIIDARFRSKPDKLINTQLKDLLSLANIFTIYCEPKILAELNNPLIVEVLSQVIMKSIIKSRIIKDLDDSASVTNCLKTLALECICSQILILDNKICESTCTSNYYYISRAVQSLINNFILTKWLSTKISKESTLDDYIRLITYIEQESATINQHNRILMIDILLFNMIKKIRTRDDLDKFRLVWLNLDEYAYEYEENDETDICKKLTQNPKKAKVLNKKLFVLSGWARDGGALRLILQLKEDLINSESQNHNEEDQQVSFELSELIISKLTFEDLMALYKSENIDLIKKWASCQSENTLYGFINMVSNALQFSTDDVAVRDGLRELVSGYIDPSKVTPANPDSDEMAWWLVKCQKPTIPTKTENSIAVVDDLKGLSSSQPDSIEVTHSKTSPATPIPLPVINLSDSMSFSVNYDLSSTQGKLRTTKYHSF